MKNIYLSINALNNIVEDGLKHLERLGYFPETLSKYGWTWRAFLRYVDDKSGENIQFKEYVDRFLESRGVPTGETNIKLSSLKRHIRSSMRVLTEFTMYGSFSIRRRPPEKMKLSRKMEHLLFDYDQFCIEKSNIGFRTMRVRNQTIKDFLYFLELKGLSSIKRLKSTIFSEFVLSKSHLKSITLASKISNIRLFLRYLVMQGLISNEIFEAISNFRVQKESLIPWVWPSKDVASMLSSVERNSSCGKRDYAILLLCTRLGMRVGDVCALCLENIKWEETKIEFKQGKTGTLLTLPLTKEVGDAIIDYLRYGRPQSLYREVFLRAKAPFQPINVNNNLHYIISKHRCKAGIKLPSQSHVGLHSLRHTLATQLLDLGTPIATISGVLGHLHHESTQIYTKVQIPLLRSVAIDPKEVTNA